RAAVGTAGGKERRRFGAAMARGCDQSNALLASRGEDNRQLRIARTGEAHIDDASAVRDCPIDALEDGERGAFVTLAGRCEGTDRQNSCGWRHACEAGMRPDPARHPGPLVCWRLRPPGGI